MAGLCSLFLGFVFRLQSPWLRYLPYLTMFDLSSLILVVGIPTVLCSMWNGMGRGISSKRCVIFIWGEWHHTGHQSVADKHGTSFHVPMLWSQSFINLCTTGGLGLCPSCSLSGGIWPLGWYEKPSQAHLKITSRSGGTATWKPLQLPFRCLCLSLLSLIFVFLFYANDLHLILLKKCMHWQQPKVFHFTFLKHVWKRGLCIYFS